MAIDFSWRNLGVLHHDDLVSVWPGHRRTLAAYSHLRGRYRSPLPFPDLFRDRSLEI